LKFKNPTAMSSQLILRSISAERQDELDEIKEQRCSPLIVLDQHGRPEEEYPHKEDSIVIIKPKTSPSISENIQKFHELWESESSGYDLSTMVNNDNIKKIREGDLSVMKLLGRGAFADVHQVYIKENTDQIYAIKRLRPSVLIESDKLEISTTDLALETSILSNLRHKNIISLLGIKEGNTIDLLRNGNFFLALELLVETLHDRLKTWKKHWSYQMLSSTLNTNTVIERLENVAMGIVSAMEYLHSNRIIYRDMKPLNIGFDELNDEVKIFDLGFARLCHKEDSNSSNKDRLMTGGIGTPRYMAPEIARHDPTYSFPVDVYSFCIMLWQIVTNRTPFNEIKSASVLAAKVTHGNKRPRLRFVQSEALRELIKSGWSANPADRPTFTEIRQKLKMIIREHHLSLPSSKFPSFKCSDKKHPQERPFGRRLFKRSSITSSPSSDSIFSMPHRTRQRSTPSLGQAKPKDQSMFGCPHQVFHCKEPSIISEYPSIMTSDETEESIYAKLKDGMNGGIENVTFSPLDDRTDDYQVPLSDETEVIEIPSLLNGETMSSVDVTDGDGDDGKTTLCGNMDTEIRRDLPFFERTNWKTKRRNTMAF